ncbi:MAG: GNAT family N-acetyltransferase [Candidatus Andersenbacteria bacterium]
MANDYGVPPHQPYRFLVRWMLKRERAKVLEIEAASWEIPWSEENLIHCLDKRNCTGEVIEYEDTIIGFMIYELHQTMIELLTLAVSPQWRRRGAGTRMVQKLASRLSVQRRPRLEVPVGEYNLAAQLFFRRQGFRAIGTLRNYWEDSSQDMYLMRYLCPQTRRTSPAFPINRLNHLFS